ncbi:MAG TPA: alpha/beta hydrolase [Gemmatimonadaceae bacterium]|nr:alpha/beta hydrolase [Gemmatimonadaceae bacterium]
MRQVVRLLVFTVLFAGIASAQQRTLNVGDALINYDVSGRAGPAVVFIHGWTHNLSVWDEQVAALSSRYRVVRFDTRGYGRSSGYSDPSADPQDLLTLLEALHIPRAYIVGHSRGGDVALRFAAAYPQRVAGLVLYGAFPEGFPAPPEVGQFFGSLSEIARKNGLDSVGKLLLSSDIAWVPPGRNDVMERYRRLWSSYNGKDLLTPQPESHRVPVPTTDEIRMMRVPTLVIVGDHEAPFIAAADDSLAKWIPGAKKVVIANAGHGAHFAQPASFNSALMDFIFSVERSTKRK